MSRIALACALCLLMAGCAAPTAPTTPTADRPAADSDGNGTNVDASAATETESTTDDATNDADETTGTAESTDIAVSGGTLPVEHERVFDRTVDLLGVNVSPPTVVVVKSVDEIRDDAGGVETPNGSEETRTFVGVMGIGRDDGNDADGTDGADGSDEDDGSDEGDGIDGSDETDQNDDADGNDEAGVSVAAYAPSAYSVVVNERLTAPERASLLERTLAHEFVHTVQFRQQAFDRLEAALDVDHPSRDARLTYVSVVEGAASFVGEAYDRRYLAGDWASITTTERYRSSSSGVKYRIARYYFGRRYLDARFDSPRNLSTVYDDPPTTTEQLLHNDTDGSEQPRPLAVTVAPGENRTRGHANVNGELFTRIALGTELDASLAADAAAGWGADRLVPVANTTDVRNRSYVWATRWDSRTEADEFAGALEEYLASRAERTNSSTVWRDGTLAFRTVRASDETVVLLAGEEPFVREASVSGTNASVSVTADGT